MPRIQHSRRHTVRTRRPLTLIDALEHRFLLAAHPAPWRLAGTPAADNIVISLASADDTQLVATLNGDTIATRSIDRVRRVIVVAGDGDDTITINLGVGQAIPAWVYGQSGNDTITGGAGRDRLFGQFGDDQISGRLGDDLLIGGQGTDQLVGDEGDDSIYGESGDDTLAGGMGDDLLVGGAGADMLSGGYGDDTVYASSGVDTLQGGDGADSLHSGTGKDIIYSEEEDRVRRDLADTFRNDFRDNPLVSIDDLDALKQRFIDQAVARYQSLYGASANLWWQFYRQPWIEDGRAHTMTNGTGTPVPNPNPDNHSGTNNQVQGVDEADMVKSDGNFIYLVHNDQLIIVDAWPADESHVLSRTTLGGWGAALYLDGSHLTVVSTKWIYDEDDWGINPGWIIDDGGGWIWAADGAPITAAPQADLTLASTRLAMPYLGLWHWRPSHRQVQVTVYDVADPAAPSVISTTSIDGSLTSSRNIDGTVYLVLDHQINLPSPEIIAGETPGTWVYQSEEAYRTRLEGMTLAELFPSYTTTFADAGRPAVNGAILDTSSLYAPQTLGDEDSMFSVITFDAAADAPQITGTTAVVGCTGQMYMSADALYVAATNYDAPMGAWLGDARTDLYRFTVSDTGVAFDSAGQVPGWIINSYAMDEHNGYLHIATTTRQVGVNDGTGETTNTVSNNVFTLQSNGSTLEVTGALTGLALTERIYAARFIGDRGYLVTFRRIDPLFTLDLSDPASPHVAGELEMPGYSSYLQPISDTLVLGIGRDADAEGRVNGLKASLFDVSDFAHPALLDTYKFTSETDSGMTPWWSDWTSSPAEWDPHALSYFPAQQILALPVLDWGWWNGHARLELLKIDPATGFTALGQIEHEGQVLRSLQIGDYLYSIGTDAIKIVSFADPTTALAEVALQTTPPTDPSDPILFI